MPDAFAQKNDSGLAIIDAGIQSSEDAPFISSGFRFAPGDPVYATFQITNFSRKQDTAESLPKIALQYAATLEDAKGLPMAAAESGAIDSELSAEDKNWTPKRRISFTLPQFAGSGKAQIRIVVKDLLAGTETSRVLPLMLGGVVVVSAESLAVQDLQFFRKENDGELLNIPAFSPGDAAYARFNMTGFKTDAQHTYRLVYDVLVLRPDGKPYLQQLHAAEISAASFYPAQFLPGVLQIMTSATSSKGIYTLTLTLHDLVGKSTVQSKTSFTLE